MLMIAFTQAELDLILFALQRLEQDESCEAQTMTEAATDLLKRWDWEILSKINLLANEEEE